MSEKADKFFVVFVGGPLHGKGILMALPQVSMNIGERGQSARYTRHSIEAPLETGGPKVAIYAVEGLSDREFDDLIASDGETAPGSV